MKYRIREAQYGDLEGIMHLLHSLYNNNVGPGLIQIIRQCLLDEKYYKTIVLDDHIAIGFFLGSCRFEVDFESKCGIIEEIIIKDEYQGEGLGRILVDRFTSWARDNDCDGLLVPCGREGFYEKIGFEKYVVKRYWKSLKP